MQQEPTFSISPTILWVGGSVLALGAIGTAIWYLSGGGGRTRPGHLKARLTNLLNRKGGAFRSSSGNNPPPGSDSDWLAASAWCRYHTYPLRLYTCHPDVQKLQQWLNRVKGERLTEDGKYGPNTEAAVLKHTGQKNIDRNFINTLSIRT